MANLQANHLLQPRELIHGFGIAAQVDFSGVFEVELPCCGRDTGLSHRLGLKKENRGPLSLPFLAHPEFGRPLEMRALVGNSAVLEAMILLAKARHLA